MKRLLLVASLVLLSTPALSQVLILKNAGRSYGVDYITANIKTFSITRFEIQLDGGTWNSIGIPPIQNDAQTLTGYDTYVSPIPDTTPLGNHTALARVCQSGTVCSDPSNPLAFVFAVIPAPANMRTK